MFYNPSIGIDPKLDITRPTSKLKRVDYFQK